MFPNKNENKIQSEKRMNIKYKKTFYNFMRIQPNEGNSSNETSKFGNEKNESNQCSQTANMHCDN